MKILVLSLLRIGDLFMQRPLLVELRRQNPDAQIDVVVNSVSSSASKLFSDIIDNVYVFSREEYQRSAGEAHFNIFWGVDQIDKLIDKLSGQKYDRVLNFTHNRLSAYLCGAIEAKEVQGAKFVRGQFQGFENPWMQYMNSCFSQPAGSVFHYTEVLSKAFNLPAQRYAVRKNSRRSGLVLMQCFTSEERKNWPLTRFRELKQKIEEQFPFHIVRILATEKERLDLLNFFSDEDVWVADFVTSATLLESAALFVGVDTSVKHLAAMMGTPCVEIACGGSEAVKTGAFIVEAVAVQGAEISVDEVFQAVSNKIQGRNERSIEEQDHEQDKNCDRWVWTCFLDGVSLGQRSLTPATNASYVAKSFKLLEWQLQLEKALTDSSDLYIKAKITKEDIKEFIIVAQEILKSNADSAGYFHKLIEALTSSGDRGDAVYAALQEAVGISRSLLKIRSEIAIGGLHGAKSREALGIGA